jgi:subtilisin family serine protease
VDAAHGKREATIMNRRGLRIVLVLLTVFLLSVSAAAADYDGYIVQLCASEVGLFSERTVLPEGMTEVYAPEGLYTVDDPELLEELQASDLVVYAEPNYYLTLLETVDDPAWAEGLQWNLAMVGMEYAWNANVTGSGVRVGIIDSGVYADHPDLDSTKILQGTNYRDETDAANTEDTVGHGTFIAGIIAAVTGNGIGIAGMASDVELVPLKIYDRSGGTIADLVKAIYGGVDDYHCQVLNLSLGVSVNTTSLRNAVAYAEEQGVILVAAAGNSSTANSTGSDALLYPAAYDSVIGVGAVDSTGTVCSFSQKNDSVFVAAPGESLYGLTKNGGYRTWEGTSFSTPMVTAAAALALSMDATLTPAQFRALLQQTAEDLGDAGYDTSYGWGLLRVDRMVRELQSHLTISQADLPESTAVKVVIAAYSSAGQMLDITIVEAETSEDGKLSFRQQVTLPEAAGSLRIMVLDDEGWQPLCEDTEIMLQSD